MTRQRKTPPGKTRKRAEKDTERRMEQLRRLIDSVDRKLVVLLNRRTAAAVRIGKIKRGLGAEAYVPAREKEVIDRVRRMNRGPLESGSLTAIFREIMSGSLAIEKNLKVAYLGPAATFSHSAARSRFGTSVDYVARESVGDVFNAVEKGDSDYGVVPIENSIQGPEAPTLDCFINSPLKVCAEIVYPIRLIVMSKSPRDKIVRIYSHPQPFGQCARWLRMQMPGIELRPVSSTAKAAEVAAMEPGAAAIGSALAAELYGLRIVETGIEDIPGNETRFMVLGRSYGRATGDDKTSVIFSVKHRAGSLHRALESFRKFGLNMTKIESRPLKAKAWQYCFFVDFEGHADRPKVKKALEDLGRHCTFCTVLGSYPQAVR